MKVVPDIKISSKFRRISISINQFDQVILKLPSKSYLANAYTFFEQNYNKIVKVLEKNRRNRPDLSGISFNFKSGDLLPVLDERIIQLEVVRSRVNKLKFDTKRKTVLINAVDTRSEKNLLKNFYKKLAKDFFKAEVDKVVNRMGLKYNSIKIKDTATRWGSCSSKANLNFNFRLLLAPKFVFEYIVVHEVCHLVEMNHSSRYWKLVESEMPDYLRADKWLKENGYLLKMYFA